MKKKRNKKKEREKECWQKVTIQREKFGFEEEEDCFVWMFIKKRKVRVQGENFFTLDCDAILKTKQKKVQTDSKSIVMFVCLFLISQQNKKRKEKCGN